MRWSISSKSDSQANKNFLRIIKLKKRHTINKFLLQIHGYDEDYFLIVTIIFEKLFEIAFLT